MKLKGKREGKKHASKYKGVIQIKIGLALKLVEATTSWCFILHCWPVAQNLNKHTFVLFSSQSVSCGKCKVNPSCIHPAFGFIVEKYR